MRLELHPEARAELRSAALWYDERRTGLGDEFIAEVSGTLDRIGNAPESYPAWPGTPAVDPLIRKAIVQRFPYVIAFEQHEQHLLILLALFWSTNLRSRELTPKRELRLGKPSEGSRAIRALSEIWFGTSFRKASLTLPPVIASSGSATGHATRAPV